MQYIILKLYLMTLILYNNKGDLWGPFLMCMFLGLILSISSKKNSGMVFTTVFVIIWIGSVIITINTRLIGGKLYKFFLLIKKILLIFSYSYLNLKVFNAMYLSFGLLYFPC